VKSLRALASLALLALAALLVLAAAAAAANATPTTSAAAPSRAAASHTHSARRPAASRPAAPDSLGRTPSGSRLAPRTLDDIHIEGEIPVPQVLFITARDQRRFMEFQHHRYTRTSLELGRGTALPSRVVVPEPGPVVGKENER
jgi:hypothetical protein